MKAVCPLKKLTHSNSSYLRQNFLVLRCTYISWMYYTFKRYEKTVNRTEAIKQLQCKRSSWHKARLVHLHETLLLARRIERAPVGDANTCARIKKRHES